MAIDGSPLKRRAIILSGQCCMNTATEFLAPKITILPSDDEIISTYADIAKQYCDSAVISRNNGKGKSKVVVMRNIKSKKSLSAISLKTNNILSEKFNCDLKVSALTTGNSTDASGNELTVAVQLVLPLNTICVTNPVEAVAAKLIIDTYEKFSKAGLKVRFEASFQRLVAYIVSPYTADIQTTFNITGSKVSLGRCDATKDEIIIDLADPASISKFQPLISRSIFNRSTGLYNRACHRWMETLVYYVAMKSVEQYKNEPALIGTVIQNDLRIATSQLREAIENRRLCEQFFKMVNELINKLTKETTKT